MSRKRLQNALGAGVSINNCTKHTLPSGESVYPGQRGYAGQAFRVFLLANKLPVALHWLFSRIYSCGWIVTQTTSDFFSNDSRHTVVGLSGKHLLCCGIMC